MNNVDINNIPKLNATKKDANFYMKLIKIVSIKTNPKLN